MMLSELPAWSAASPIERYLATCIEMNVWRMMSWERPKVFAMAERSCWRLGATIG